MSISCISRRTNNDLELDKIKTTHVRRRTLPAVCPDLRQYEEGKRPRQIK